MREFPVAPPRDELDSADAFVSGGDQHAARANRRSCSDYGGYCSTAIFFRRHAELAGGAFVEAAVEPYPAA